MNPSERVYLIHNPAKQGVVEAKRWHDFTAEYWVLWDDGTRELHTVETIARVPKSHRRKG